MNGSLIYFRKFAKNKNMLQTISIDEKTMLIKADNATALSELYVYLNNQNKKKSVNDLLAFASKRRVIENNFKFNRNDCYVR
jgi:hypothetical protein